MPARNEVRKIERVVERTLTWSREAGGAPIIDTLLVIDDASHDGTAEVAGARGAKVQTMLRPSGVGAAIRAGLEYASGHGFDIAVILAGNDKDEPREIPRLLDPICRNESDFVMGSRYVEGGSCGGDMPLYRKWATRFHPWLMSIGMDKRITESTNGFRAFKLSILTDARINLNQRWLDAYGLEVYLLWKVLRLGYRHCEVPCTKTYPPKGIGYTKMVPGIGWWSILRPVFLLQLGVKS